MESIAALIRYAPLIEQGVVTIGSLLSMRKAGITDEQIQTFLDEELPRLERRNESLANYRIATNFPGE